MFGESGGGRSIASPRAKPKGSSSALLSRQSNAIGLQFYSTHEPSRICSNPLKTNEASGLPVTKSRGQFVPF